VRHFTEAELDGAITLHEAVEAMRAAFIEFAQGRANVQQRVPTDAPGGFRLNTMAAVLPAAGVAGAKVYTAFNGRFSFVILLFSTVDGRILASFDAGSLTKLRTAAVSALAAQYLARPESATLAIFGTGTQAEGHARYLSQRFPIERILIVGRAHARDFACGIAATTGIATLATDAPTALKEADIVVTATRSPTPIFAGKDLDEGTTLIAIGSSRPQAVEIDAETIARSTRIVVESEDAARHESGDLLAAERAGTDPWHKLATLGDLCVGRAPGRQSATEILIFESLGLALEDVAIAAKVYEKLQ